MLVRAGLVRQERTGRISRCRLEAGPIYAAAVWLNRYSKYWQTQFDTLAAWLAELDGARSARRLPRRADQQHRAGQRHRYARNARSRHRLHDSKNRMSELRGRIMELRKELRAAQQTIEPEPVRNYSLKSSDGMAVPLQQLFGDKDTLIVIHNMGAGCVYCTMWADGFNGVYDHLRDRAAFVVTSPDPPEKQRQFAQGRGWEISGCSRTPAPASRRTWVMHRAAAGRPASACSSGMAMTWCAYRTLSSDPVTTSAVSGTSSICCPKDPPAGNRSIGMDDCASRGERGRRINRSPRPLACFA